MPRQARLDASGTLHHVMIRGTERSQVLIFNYVPHIPHELTKCAARYHQFARARLD